VCVCVRASLCVYAYLCVCLRKICAFECMCAHWAHARSPIVNTVRAPDQLFFRDVLLPPSLSTLIHLHHQNMSSMFGSGVMMDAKTDGDGDTENAGGWRTGGGVEDHMDTSNDDGARQSATPQAAAAASSETNFYSSTLFIGDLPDDLVMAMDDKRQLILEICAAHGTVESIRVIPFKRFAFVRFARPDEADAAMAAIDGQLFGGIPLRVSRARNQSHPAIYKKVVILSVFVFVFVSCRCVCVCVSCMCACV
jgi:RNA recognition motif